MDVEREAKLLDEARALDTTMVCADALHYLCRGEIVGEWDAEQSKLLMLPCTCPCHTTEDDLEPA